MYWIWLSCDFSSVISADMPSNRSLVGEALIYCGVLCTAAQTVMYTDNVSASRACQ